MVNCYDERMTRESIETLAYQTPGARAPHRRWWYVWMLPLLWLPGAIVSCVYVGYDYANFLAANLSVVLLAGQVKSTWSTPQGVMEYAGMVAAGAVLMSLAGAALDALVTWRRGAFVQIPLAIVAGIMAWQFISPWERNSGEGSEVWLTMFHAFWSIGVYVIVVGALLIVSCIRATQRVQKVGRASQKTPDQL